MPIFYRHAIKFLLDPYRGSFNADVLAKMLGVKCSEDDDLEYKDIAEKVEAQPERCLLALIYSSYDMKNEYFYYDWQGKYAVNERLNNLYELLEELGYEVSDEENRMRLGIHELFAEQEDDEDE